jgi:serpin B
MLGADSTFAGHLYGQLSSRSGNLFFSPASIHLALAMAYAGARGDTAAEMQRALGVGPQSHAAFADLLRNWEKLAHPDDPYAGRTADSPQMQKYREAELARRRIVLNVVNRLWAQSGYPFRDEFLVLLRDQYRAPIAQVDFHRDPEAEREQINKWVSAKTEQKITELIARGIITPDTRLMITNAVYFKALWTSQFAREQTREETFFAEGKREVRVPLMRQISTFPLATFGGGQLVELPYAYGELVMDVVLPAERNGLADIERRFASGALRGWLDALKKARVDLTLPRFKMSSAFELETALGALGMRKAFTYREADFSGMDGTRELFISAVLHQAVVDVDEYGTEAAAATSIGVEVATTPPVEAPVIFRADHPFLFLIRDAKSGAILFLGRVVNPQ